MNIDLVKTHVTKFIVVEPTGLWSYNLSLQPPSQHDPIRNPNHPPTVLHPSAPLLLLAVTSRILL